MKHDHKWVRRGSALAAMVLMTIAPGQEMAQRAGQDANDVKIIKPTVDKAAGRVTIAGAFWNQKLADWVEVAMCGRPSDFLHETLICATTTRAEMEKALREAGFRDADVWADSAKDFPRVRGDRLLILVTFSQDGKQETYALDELLSFQGWGAAVGPYGFMFKGDPERGSKAPATAPANPFAPPPAAQSATDADSVKILRDDPQIALVFKGLQSMSQSLADYPLAYDDWVYPMLNYSRNYGAMAPAVFNSNGQIPVTISLEKVSEEELLTRSAKVWHDAGWREAILKQVNVAKGIDNLKAVLLKTREAAAAENKVERPAPDHAEILREFGRREQWLLAGIERGYATLDAAWAAYGAAHAKFQGDDPRLLEQLQQQAKLWAEHLELTRVAAEQRAIVAELQAETKPGGNPRTVNGKMLVAESAALAAESKQDVDYWKEQWSRLDPANDPRVDWIKTVHLQVELADARQETAKTGEALGKMMQASPEIGPTEQAAASRYRAASARIGLADVGLKLAGVSFEISKRESFENDPDLPKLRETKQQLEQQLKALQAATQPAR